jgi:hypothetical protein
VLDLLVLPAGAHPEMQGSAEAIHDWAIQEKLDRLCGSGPC